MQELNLKNENVLISYENERCQIFEKKSATNIFRNTSYYVLLELDPLINARLADGTLSMITVLVRKNECLYVIILRPTSPTIGDIKFMCATINHVLVM